MPMVSLRGCRDYLLINLRTVLTDRYDMGNVDFPGLLDETYVQKREMRKDLGLFYPPVVHTIPLRSPMIRTMRVV